jgi:MoaA/NifB/PqqE/SkfB family radical SAM enzyme
MTEATTQETQPWIGPNGQVMERLELHLTYTCPEKCIFCSEDHRMKKYNPFPVSWARVATVIRKHFSRGVRNLHVTGGEPTIHPQFIDVLRLAKKLGMRTSVGTIGTMLAREDFAREALPFLDEALFSIHGPNAEVHDGLTRKEGSFERVTTALTLALQIKPEFGAYVNTVVTRHNIDTLPDTVEMAERLGASLVVVSNTTPEGAAEDHYEELAVPLEKLAEILPQVPGRVKNTVVRFFGVPMCLMGEHTMLANDMHWDPRVTAEWGSQPGKVVFDDFYNWKPDRKRVHVTACNDCSLNKVCMGVYERYTSIWPEDLHLLTPISLDKE